MNALELPAGANPARDQIVGRDELGRTIRKTLMGATYTTGEGYTPQPSAPSLFDVIVEPSRLMAGGVGNMATTQTPPQGSPSQGLGPIAGLLNSIWDTVSIPGNAAKGQEPTLGGLLDLASMVQLGGGAAPAPQGALRSGAMRETMTAAQSKADEILQLLKSGRGSEVTDEMLSAADPQYLWANYDLPMDSASRMDRARGMGFEPNMPLYHGTNTEAESKILESGFNSMAFGSPRYNVAEDYAGNAAGWTSEPAVIEFIPNPLKGGVDYDSPGAAISSFRDGLSFNDVYKSGGSMGFDPSGVRLADARFDPRLSHLANLSAIGAGGAYLGGLLGFNPVTGLPYESDQ